MQYDVQRMNCYDTDFAAGTQPLVFDMGANWSNVLCPSANYGASTEQAVAEDVVLTVKAGMEEDGSDGEEVCKVTIPAGSRMGWTVLPTLKGRYISASVTGSATGKFCCGIVWGVPSPIGVGLNA